MVIVNIEEDMIKADVDDVTVVANVEERDCRSCKLDYS